MDHQTDTDTGQERAPLDRRHFLRRAATMVAFTAPLVVASACEWVPKVPTK